MKVWPEHRLMWSGYVLLAGQVHSDLEELYMEYTGLSDLNILKNNKKLRKMTIGVSCTNITLESMKGLNQLEEIYFYPDTDENKIEELRKLQDAG